MNDEIEAAEKLNRNGINEEFEEIILRRQEIGESSKECKIFAK